MKDVIFFSLSMAEAADTAQFIFRMPSMYAQNQYICHLSASFVSVLPPTFTPVMNCLLYAKNDNVFGGDIRLVPQLEVDALSPNQPGGTIGAVAFNSNMPLTNVRIPVPTGFYYLEVSVYGGVTSFAGNVLMGISRD